jgi:hypothetical protein
VLNKHFIISFSFRTFAHPVSRVKAESKPIELLGELQAKDKI